MEHTADFTLPKDDDDAIPPILPQADSAEQLREQAAACRRLALRSRTRAGKNGLDALGDHFDTQAQGLDPLSQRR
jgi:hypothetical protein